MIAPKPAKRQKRKAPPKPQIVSKPLGSHMEPRVSMLQERLIGHIVIVWARIEAMLQDIIWLLFGMDLAEGRLITARLDVRPKLAMVEALAPRRIMDAALLATLLDAVDIIRLRHGDRNFIVHGSWGTIVRHPMTGD